MFVPEVWKAFYMEWQKHDGNPPFYAHNSSIASDHIVNYLFDLEKEVVEDKKRHFISIGQHMARKVS